MTDVEPARGAPGTEVVRPTREDPMLRGVSAFLGGPAGDHAGRHRWWTPLRVLLAVTAVCFALGMVQKTGCYAENWQNGTERYAQMCYSDLPYLYTDRGFAEGEWPYSTDPEVRSRYSVMEYPVGIAYVAWLTGEATHLVRGSPDLAARADVAVGELASRADVRQEVRWFVVLTALLLALAAMASTWLLARAHPRRPWDAAVFAASPALALTGLVNWDLLAVVAVCGALWAWSRDRPLLTGVLVGVGVAVKLYPLFLLGALLVICLRQQRVRALVTTVGAMALTWGLLNAPAYVLGPGPWKVFWQFNSDRRADLGSAWLMLQDTLGHDFSPHTINGVSWILFGVWCLGVLVLGLKAPATPRLAQLGLLVIVGFLLVNKVYSPQYVLWLLPLAALARPVWRDQLVWQASEIFYFAAVWWYLGGFLAPAGTDGQPAVYWIAIVTRMAGELWLAGVVARDVMRPEHDVVRASEDQPRTSSSTSVAV